MGFGYFKLRPSLFNVKQLYGGNWDILGHWSGCSSRCIIQWPFSGVGKADILSLVSQLESVYNAAQLTPLLVLAQRSGTEWTWKLASLFFYLYFQQLRVESLCGKACLRITSWTHVSTRAVNDISEALNSFTVTHTYSLSSTASLDTGPVHFFSHNIF